MLYFLLVCNMLSVGTAVQYVYCLYPIMCVTVIMYMYMCVTKFMLGCVIDWSYQSDHVYHMIVFVSGGTFLASF